ncbi:SPOR domain-containing protein [Candidatus Marinimicrobia bacterium]|nr:SPOR domain-containing protein [Candidatus Neomarinimicrobiota bacterium]|tara:strand:- start:329 stop:748 length:420 start_codon:yes stop_codon:yes gene_type:complete
MIILFFLFSTLLIAQDNKIDFEPDQLIDPELNWPLITSPLNSKNIMDNNISIDTTQFIIEGFRVQLLATKELVNAEQLKKNLLAILNQSIYITFEAPNYKVRVGNFIDRNKAEKFRKEIIKKGYASAWIIRTRIEPIMQ